MALELWILGNGLWVMDFGLWISGNIWTLWVMDLWEMDFG